MIASSLVNNELPANRVQQFNNIIVSSIIIVHACVGVFWQEVKRSCNRSGQEKYCNKTLCVTPIKRSSLFFVCVGFLILLHRWHDQPQLYLLQLNNTEPGVNQDECNSVLCKEYCFAASWRCHITMPVISRTLCLYLTAIIQQYHLPK